MKIKFLLRFLAGLLGLLVVGILTNDVMAAGVAGYIGYAITVPAGMSTGDFLRQLKEQRAELMTEIKGLAEKDELSDEEAKRFDTLDVEIKELDGKIDAATKLHERGKTIGEYREQFNGKGKQKARKVTNEEEKVVRDFSYVKFFREIVAQTKGEGSLEGLELEMAQEATSEAKGLGKELKGFGVPGLILGAGRDMTVGVPADGGNLLQDEKMLFMDALKDALVMTQMGATFLTGLRGNVPLTSVNGMVAASWINENDEAPENTPTFTRKTISPKRLAAFVDVSKQLLIQDSVGVEALLRNQFVYAIALALQNAAINGSGTGAVPEGILNTTGIGSVALGTDGAAPTWNSIVGLETKVAENNADIGSLGYLMNAKVRGTLKVTKKDAGSGLFLMNSGNELNGYKAGVTGSVPSKLAKGAGTNLSATIFGNFKDVAFGQWGGLDITVNPFTKSKLGLIEMQVDSFMDVAILRAKSFAAITDMVTENF